MKFNIGDIDFERLKRLINATIGLYGRNLQMNHAVQELAELIVEITRLNRSFVMNPEDVTIHRMNVADECADAVILIASLIEGFDLGEPFITAMNMKMTRTESRLIKDSEKLKCMKEGGFDAKR